MECTEFMQLCVSTILGFGGIAVKKANKNICSHGATIGIVGREPLDGYVNKR